MKAFLDSKNIPPAQLFSGTCLKCIFKGENKPRKTRKSWIQHRKKKEREKESKLLQKQYLELKDLSRILQMSENEHKMRQI